MKIDSRVLIPFVGPFVILGMIRLLCWLAGAEWSDPGLAVAMSLFIGGMGGTSIMAAMFIGETPIGSITIGKGEPE